MTRKRLRILKVQQKATDSEPAYNLIPGEELSSGEGLDPATSSYKVPQTLVDYGLSVVLKRMLPQRWSPNVTAYINVTGQSSQPPSLTYTLSLASLNSE